LSRDAIIEAAWTQAAEHGLDSLSTRTVAARLDVTPMALYRHVRDMDEIVGAVVDGLLAERGLPVADVDWREWLQQLARSLRGLFLKHPAAVGLFIRQPVTTPAARIRLEATVGVLVEAGFTRHDAVRAYAAVHTYTIGFCGLEAGRLRAPAPVEPLDAAQDPTSVAIRGFVTDEQFAYGLRALVYGLVP